MAHLLNEQGRRVGVEHVINVCHNAHFKQRLYDLGGLDRHLLSEISNLVCFADLNVAHRDLGWLFERLSRASETVASATRAAAAAAAVIAAFENEVVVHF